MKFWELISVCRAEPKLLERLADKPEWTVYLDWYRNEDQIVEVQDRSKLDAEMPDDACLARSMPPRPKIRRPLGAVLVKGWSLAVLRNWRGLAGLAWAPVAVEQRGAERAGGV